MTNTNTISEAVELQNQAKLSNQPPEAKGLEHILLVLCQIIAYAGGVILILLTLMTVYHIVGLSLVKDDYIWSVSLRGQELFAIPLQFLDWWRPIKGHTELIELGTAMAIFSFLPYCQIVRGNVLVDFFTNRAHPRVQASMDVLGNAIFTVIAGLFTWRMIVKSEEMLSASWRESSMMLQIPVWWTVVAATCFMGFLTVVCLFTVFRSIREAATPITPNKHSQAGKQTGEVVAN